MDPSISDLYRLDNESSEKFDYFICGVAGALFAYLSESYTPSKVGLNGSTIELLAMLLLALSFYFGIKRLEGNNTCRKINYKINLSANQRSSGRLSESHQNRMQLSEETWREDFERRATIAQRHYQARNWSLILGFAVIFCGNVAQPYLNSPDLTPTVRGTEMHTVPAPNISTNLGATRKE